MIDYHVHTRLCNHAEGAMSEFVRRAVDIGLDEICFLDHLTLQEQGRDLSMSPQEVPFYFQVVQALKQTYAGKITVKAGLEIDFSEECAQRAADIAGTYAFDVIGSSVHFPQGVDIVRRRSAWKDKKKSSADTDRVYQQYYEVLDRMLDYDYFDIICHFDLVKKFGRKPSRSFDREITAILKKVKQKDRTIELNTSGYDHTAGEAYPAPDIVEKCGGFGISFALGSDAHNPQSVGRYFDKAFQLLKEAGYREIATFDRREKRMIPIDLSKITINKTC